MNSVDLLWLAAKAAVWILIPIGMLLVGLAFAAALDDARKPKHTNWDDR